MRKKQEEEEQKLIEDYKAGLHIDREVFNKNDNRKEDLHLQLSEKYMIYKDYAERSMINPQHIGK